MDLSPGEIKILILSVAAFATKELWSILSGRTRRLLEAVASLEKTCLELRIVVSRLESDLKELWRVKGDVNSAWQTIRKLEAEAEKLRES